jgi:hypothetical protein
MDRIQDFLTSSASSGENREAQSCPFLQDHADALAAYTEGGLAPSQQQRVEEHLGDCGTCRSIVIALQQEDLPEKVPEEVSEKVPDPQRVTDLRRAVLLVAAALIVLFVPWRAWHVLHSVEATLGQRLQEAAEEMAALHPAWFDGFQPLARLPAPPAQVARSQGLQLLYPRAQIMVERPWLSFVDRTSAGPWKVTLRTADGSLLWQVFSDQQFLDYPAEQAGLAAGSTYLWTVNAAENGVAIPAGRTFRRAGDADRRQLDQAFEALAAAASADLVGGLQASYAIHLGAFAMALEAAQTFRDDHPHEALAQAILARVRGELGIDPGPAVSVLGPTER